MQQRRVVRLQLGEALSSHGAQLAVRRAVGVLKHLQPMRRFVLSGLGC